MVKNEPQWKDIYEYIEWYINCYHTSLFTFTEYKYVHIGIKDRELVVCRKDGTIAGWLLNSHIPFYLVDKLYEEGDVPYTPPHTAYILCKVHYTREAICTKCKWFDKETRCPIMDLITVKRNSPCEYFVKEK